MAAAEGQSAADRRDDGEVERPGADNGLLARMLPLHRDRCIATMRVSDYRAGQTIIEEGSMGTTMVRPPSRIVALTQHCLRRVAVLAGQE